MSLRLLSLSQSNEYFPSDVTLNNNIYKVLQISYLIILTVFLDWLAARAPLEIW